MIVFSVLVVYITYKILDKNDVRGMKTPLFLSVQKQKEECRANQENDGRYRKTHGQPLSARFH